MPAAVDGNPYAYAGGDPLTGTDPSGHFDPGDFNPVQVAEDVGRGRRGGSRQRLERWPG